MIVKSCPCGHITEHVAIISQRKSKEINPINVVINIYGEQISHAQVNNVLEYSLPTKSRAGTPKHKINVYVALGLDWSTRGSGTDTTMSPKGPDNLIWR